MKIETSPEIQSIINQHTVLATAAAAIPIPIADSVAITGIQLAMIGRIGIHYDRIVSKETLRGIIINVAGAGAGIFIAGLLKSVPFLGTVIATVIQMSIAGSITYLIGLTVDHIFKHGLELNSENFKKFSKEFENEAKEKAEDLRKRAKDQIPINKEINFHPTNKKFKSQVTFNFSKNGREAQKIEIRNSSSGEVVFETEISSEVNSITWKPKTNTEKGSYMAFLYIKNLLPISTQIEYV